MSAVVQVRDDGVWASSLDVAESFGRRHDHVLRTIQSLLKQQSDLAPNFGEVIGGYANGKGGTQKRRYYVMDRKGFVLLAMGFTGEKALEWKIAYIDAFDRMEAALRASVNDDDDDDDDAPMSVPYMGSQTDRDNFKTAVSVVRMYERNWGPVAARAVAVKMGFPMMDVDLPVPVPPSALKAGEGEIKPLSREQLEGDVVKWGDQVKLTPSRRDATHQSELYDSYARWCSVYSFKPTHPDRFAKMMDALFGTEEHPEMYRCVMKRP